MPGRRRSAIEDAVPVMVPRNEKPLVPVTAARARLLREHLLKVLSEAPGLPYAAPATPPETSEFSDRVARTACTLCKGSCCRNGGDHGFLDEETVARVFRDMPDLDPDSLVRLYEGRVPRTACEGSCIFHGSKGCTLDRSLRADICNSYFCGGLTAFLQDWQQESPRVVIAGEGAGMRTSAILLPCP